MQSNSGKAVQTDGAEQCEIIQSSHFTREAPKKKYT